MTRAAEPRPNLVPTSSRGQFQQIAADWVIPHESTSSLRPRPMPGRGRGRGGDLVQTSSLTKHFTANTCRKCRHITIAGLWVGLRIDLEPQVLTDLDEYHAIRDGIRTWNLYPDRTAKPRDVTAIRYRTVTDRHARHTCGHTYGTQPATSHQALNATIPDEPQF